MSRAAKKASAGPVGRRYPGRVTWRSSVQGEAQRPFRLWDAKAKLYIQRRYYSTPQRAHMAALYEVRWNPVGTVVEVVDCRTGRLLGQYVHRVGGIDYLE